LLFRAIAKVKKTSHICPAAEKKKLLLGRFIFTPKIQTVSGGFDFQSRYFLYFGGN